MKILTKNSAHRYQRDNIVSFLLISASTCQAKGLSITLVEMAPGGRQQLHAHPPEQMYYILEGSGVMRVDDEQAQVNPGDCVFIPSLARHGLENSGGVTLKYLSAASPSFTPAESDAWWPLPSLNEENE
jgi:mannose-6-phosphate isomerase-like protein (cupin superfamily)